MATKKKSADVEVVTKAVADVETLADDVRTLSWIWDGIVQNDDLNADGRQFATAIHGGVARIIHVLGYPDLREKLLDLVRDAAKRRAS